MKKLPKNWHTLYTSEINKKRSLALKGMKKSKETKTKMSKSDKGRKLSENTKRKISETQRKRCLEGKHNWWQGGKSFEPYTIDWTETLKRSVRQRDKYTCQICGKEPAICVHHIDYDKENCSPENLITLCKSCHSKTNNNRRYWKLYLKALLTWKRKNPFTEESKRSGRYK